MLARRPICPRSTMGALLLETDPNLFPIPNFSDDSTQDCSWTEETFPAIVARRRAFWGDQFAKRLNRTLLTNPSIKKVVSVLEPP